MDNDSVVMSEGLGGFDPATHRRRLWTISARRSSIRQFLSTRTIERAAIAAWPIGARCSVGTAPSAIAAARRVALGGRVVGVDYAEGMLAVARQNVAASGVAGVELVQGDILTLPYGAEFDAVVCVLGIFFLPDMAAAARSLWRYVRPGGTPRSRPSARTSGSLRSRTVEAVGRARPDVERVLPWRRTERREIHDAIFRDAGIPHVQIHQQIDDIPFDPQDWTTIVMGSALRRMAVDLGDRAAEVIRDTEGWARHERLTSVRVSSLHATAIKR